jgi:hypothetical protein
MTVAGPARQLRYRASRAALRSLPSARMLPAVRSPLQRASTDLWTDAIQSPHPAFGPRAERPGRVGGHEDVHIEGKTVFACQPLQLVAHRGARLDVPPDTLDNPSETLGAANVSRVAALACALHGFLRCPHDPLGTWLQPSPRAIVKPDAAGRTSSGQLRCDAAPGRTSPRSDAHAGGAKTNAPALPPAQPRQATGHGDRASRAHSIAKRAAIRENNAATSQLPAWP